MDAIATRIEEGRYDEAWRLLHREARGVTEYRAMQALCRLRRRLAAVSTPPPQPANVRVALLSGATTSLLEEPLLLLLEAAGVAGTIHASPYNSHAREMLDPASESATFDPDVAIVVVTPAHIAAWPAWTAPDEEVQATIDRVCDEWIELCRALRTHAGCDIVLDNFHALPERPLGTAGAKVPGEANRFLRGVNEALARRVPDWVHIHDVATLAGMHGIYQWFDARYWYHARQPVSFGCLVPYVRSLAQLTASLYGRSAKCVVVDLDNTLWGGVVGDDGPERLVLGEGDPQGEAFSAFQRYLLCLRERGVMLAVSSKNEEAHVLAAFETRPEMVLRRGDFAAFQVNWRPKSENLREVAAALNIGLDALVFVDDNPAEREEVRRALPDVRVVELSADPSDYPAALDSTGWLDVAFISQEDRTRSAMVRANAAREELRTSASDYAAYLHSLDQRAVIAPFDETHLDRITQLTNKTNQFNLTTQRMNRSELATMMDSPHHVTAYVRLADRFGDNGLISVFAARREEEELWIELWLMSCRVFGRGVEQLLCNHIVDRARAAGCRSLHGVYIPTARNALVKEHYAKLGFDSCGSRDGAEHWRLEVARYSPFDTAITVVDDYRSGQREPKDG